MTDLVQKTAKGPDVALEVVASLADPLWTHVVGRANQTVGGGGLGTEVPPQTQVTQLHYPLCCDEDIGRLDI